MRKIYNEVIEYKLAELRLEIKSIKLLLNNVPKWTKPIPIGISNKGKQSESTGITKAIGVYKIIHAPTGKVMSIGQGKISARKGRHVSIFKNRGKSIFHTSSGASEGSQTGTKMYRFDKNLNNWLFCWCDVSNKNIAVELENQLILKHKPPFNLQTMAGVN